MKTRLLISALFLTMSFLYAQNVQFRIGSNFPFRGHEINMQMVFPILRQTGVKSIRQMTYSDVAWKEIEPEDDQWNFLYSDSSIFNGLGITAVPTLYGISAGVQDSVGLQVPWQACQTPGCGWHFSDSVVTKDYVTTLINRYKTGTKYWEVSNEMDTKTRYPAGLPTPIFSDFLKMNYRWIKEIDNEAQVLLPGLVGTYGFPLDEYTWLKDLLELGGGEAFDIMNYHDYNSWWTLPVHFDSVKAILERYGYGEKPIWVTESSVSSDPNVSITPDYASFDEQAADVWRRSAVLFASGAEVFFWHSFWSGGGEWKEFGLLNAFGKKKKSFYSFKLLVEEIEGFVNAGKISFGEVSNDNENGGDGVWAVKYFFPDYEEKWTLWSPDNQSFNLTGVHSNAVEITTTVPLTITADGEYAEFQIDTLFVNSGEITIQLSGIPVLVKGINVTEIGEEDNFPNEFVLKQNYPNPFGKSASSAGVTTIDFTLPQKSFVRLTLYNELGETVRVLLNEQREAGFNKFSFDASNLSSGVYFYELKTKGFSASKKMLIIN